MPSLIQRRYVLDASVLVAIVNSDHDQHFSCYSFFRSVGDNKCVRWVVPGLIFFEFQATQSRLHRRRQLDHKVFRNAPLNYENTDIYHVTENFLTKVYKLDLYNKFNLLRGQDLLYACIAHVEGIPLVTHDSDFDPYSDDLTVIKPRDLYGTGDKPLHTGFVSVRRNGKTYKVGYEVFRGVVRLVTGQATHSDEAGASVIARLLLSEIIESGLADKLNLGQRT